MKRNWTALALALGLTLTLTACGGNPGTAETPGSAAPTDATSATHTPRHVREHTSATTNASSSPVGVSPARATQTMSRLGLRRRPKFTGVGLDQPKMNTLSSAT